ncbi:DinB family protein [Flavihumibacter stibioxidans]|uniref:Damage-inducible protein DinB n=1 Tax=Flavihumibacter stibioxidans TaxID=1834163 RepID=A0ABR7MC42_9BACT|nr:hypothetical protein [Flavihumibacter stibioxidans]
MEYTEYHFWANRMICSRILELDPAWWTKEVVSSFPSLHQTLRHMEMADSAWWQRVQDEAMPFAPPDSNTDTPELVKLLLEQNERWLRWAKETAPDGFDRIISYSNSKGQAFQTSCRHILMHVVNHGTYHRGQLVTMMRTLGAENIPQTDFVHWIRVEGGKE